MKNLTIVALSIAVCFEFYLLMRKGNPESAIEKPPALSSKDYLLNSLEKENEELRQKLESIEEPATEVSASRIEKDATRQDSLSSMRAITSLSARKLIKVDVSLLDDDGTLNEGFIELYNLSSYEVEELGSLLAKSEEAIAKVTKQHANVSVSNDGGIEVKVEPFLKEGSEIYDQLFTGFEAVLGNERYNSMIGLVGEQIEREFDRFGAYERKISISKQQSENGDTALSVKDTQEWGEGEGIGSHWRSYQDLDELLNDHEFLRGMLP